MSRKKVAVTGSVAYDYLMTFPGVFTDYLLPDRLDRISVSFLVDEMRRVRGGCAPNIAYAMALMGERPKILAAGGADARDYRDWLEREGVDVTGFSIFEDVFTASFFVSTDRAQNQIATFYAGAMARAGDLRLGSIEPSSLGLAIISPNDPGAMSAYAEECRSLAIPFVYDPSQQVARLSGEELAAGMDGARMVICNDYEMGVLTQKTGMDEEAMLRLADVLVTTHGAQGSTIRTNGDTVAIPAARLRGEALDPTGVGDAYRGAMLAGMIRGWPWEMCGQAASVAAAFCLEAVGPQPPRYSRAKFWERYEENFGPVPAAVRGEPEDLD